MKMRSLIRLIPAGLLGAGVAVLVSCGSSGKGLIPVQYAGPLKNDFQAVVQAANEGDGSCTATDAKIRKTEHDLRALPATVDGGLRGRLAEGVANLGARARQLCTQPLAQTTTTSATTSTTPPPASTETQTTPPTETQSTAPTGTSTGPSTTPPSGEEGGTQAPGVGNGEVQPGEAGPGGASGGGGASSEESGSSGGTGSPGSGQ
jgi:hypothetical protein